MIRQEQSARDFSSGQGIFSKEYFVYFEKKYRGPGGKDPLTAAGELCGVAPKIKTAPSIPGTVLQEPIFRMRSGSADSLGGIAQNPRQGNPPQR